MRINSITPISIYNSYNKFGSHKEHSFDNTLTSYALPSTPCDFSINFQRSAKNGEPLRKLLSYGIPDMYTGQIMLDPSFLEKLLQKHVFSQQLKTIVRVLKPHEESLLPVARKIFENIEQIAKNEPEQKLDIVIHRMAPQAQKDLSKIQTPIFERLALKALEMPEKPLMKFRELMAKTKLQLENKPFAEPFNKKDFRYKLSRIQQEIKQRGVKDEIKTMDKLIKMSSQFTNNEQRTLRPGSILKNKTKSNNKNNKFPSNSKILQQLYNVFIHSSLENDKSLSNLFNNVRNQIFEIPTVIPFQRKVFIRSLKEITDTLKDRRLANDIHIIAKELPTSQQQVCAFVMKHSHNSSEKIGYELLNNSIGTIEHLVPYKKGGKDTLDNYGLAMQTVNSERGNRDMNTQRRLYPDMNKNCQKYIDKMIELCNKGIFEKVGLTKRYIEHFADILQKLTSGENPIILNLSKLN